ncbi:CCD17 protein, partial [Amia calva]|nr:CCD17 protein [Amia calva]
MKVLELPAAMSHFSCSKCNMTFKSALLLAKHEEKFCIGGDLGPQDMVEKVRDYKKRREGQRKLHQMRERQLLHEMENRERQSQHEARELVHSLKPSSDPGGQSSRVHWIHSRETQMRHLAENHGRHVADIVTENRELEKQRKEIDFRLQELAAQTKNVSEVEKMLQELKAQEQRNALHLESLREQLQAVQQESMRNKVHSRHSDSQLYTSKNKEKEMLHSQTYVPFYGGGVLSSEISAVRLTYLQNGGNDQMILAQLQDLLKEALQVEEQGKQSWNHRPKDRSKHHRGHDAIKSRLNRDLITIEIENQRLEEEITKFQLKKRTEPQLPRTTYNYRPTDQKIKAMRADIDLLKQEIDIHRLRRRMKTTAVQDRHRQTSLSPLPPLEDVRSQTPTLANNFFESADGLGPAPYDPVAGFVVFYDFLLGLDSFYRVCRLVVGLYNGPQEMGNPAPLPPVYCEPASLSPYQPDKRGNLATLATKQAVPRVRPSPTISLVLELQASGGYDPYGQEVSRLVSRGWVKLDIFDSHNRVISGRWKVPIRILPVKPSLTTGEINGVPQLENAELYLRIVNARDADMQSSAPISPNNATLYKYPPLTAARTSLAAEALLTAFHQSAHRFPNSQLPFPSYAESVDPPPPSGMLYEDFNDQL